MKKFLHILSLLLVISGQSFSQAGAPANKLPKPGPHDEIIIHAGYTLSFNKTYHIADWVAYELTAEETVPVVLRNNHFVPDPLLSSCALSNADYKGSGYDRGHLAPSADMCYSQLTMEESFYLSNMSPQRPGFNRGIWKKLEEQVRLWAVDDGEVYVVTGTVLKPGLPTIGPDEVTVPAYFYKVILNDHGPGLQGIAFLMPNEASQEPLQHYAVTIDSVEKLTGTNFFYRMPEGEQRNFESKIDLSRWSWPATGRSNHHNLADSNDNPNRVIQHQGNKRSIPVRCSAITGKGSECKKMTRSPNGKCWQHGGD
ncbi:MAG: DNA/RNA non-specific endonuclease [Bacteroidota bacterium]